MKQTNSFLESENVGKLMKKICCSMRYFTYRGGAVQHSGPDIHSKRKAT